MATVKEVIEKLAEVENQQAEVLVREGWNPMVPAHYTMDVEINGLGEPIIVATYRVNDEHVDSLTGKDYFQ